MLAGEPDARDQNGPVVRGPGVDYDFRRDDPDDYYLPTDRLRNSWDTADEIIDRVMAK